MKYYLELQLHKNIQTYITQIEIYKPAYRLEESLRQQ
jgi:hypothetical protein